MSLHVSLLTPHSATPTYLLTCARTYHRTLLDPTTPADISRALAGDAVDLILLTTLTPEIQSAATILHHHTGAPILALNPAGTSRTNTPLPIARPHAG